VALALTFGLVFGLRSKKGHDTNDNDQFSETWNNPSEFLPSKNFIITSSPTTHYYEWTISQSTIAPDGLERPMLLVNGMFPGPLIEANTGDRIVVKVTNKMVNGTAIHWHGMFQNVPPFGWTVIRFVNDNPGMWAFHCHIEWHMEAGLMIQFESLPQIIKTFQIPPEMGAMCSSNTPP
ncbi:hypothetical protein BGZ76_000199, partial [Entomortierella beljakovae]